MQWKPVMYLFWVKTISSRSVHCVCTEVHVCSNLTKLWADFGKCLILIYSSLSVSAHFHLCINHLTQCINIKIFVINKDYYPELVLLCKVCSDMTTFEYADSILFVSCFFVSLCFFHFYKYVRLEIP